MPAPATIDAFLEVLGKSGLVETERLRLFLQQNAALSATPRKLAARLVAAGLLTQFQAEQLLLGKHRGFTLGKYLILERIGAGGHSTVYLGEHVLVKRRVAIKVLPTARSENPAALARFYREARAAGALDHPNLVKAHDVGQDNGLHFLVMEYVDGSSLQQLVSRFGPLSIERSAHYVRQAAQGLHAAHAAGLVHRDIKPANILLDHHGVIRVLDLGLARFSCDNEDPLTLKFDNNNVLGTADYVAPEQALNSHEVDSRADIYSLGATFYFLLTGRPLFPEGQITHKLIWHQTRQPTPVRQLRPEVPGKLAAVVERMIDKQPGRRYQTAEEVIEALLPWTATPLPPPRAEEMPRLSPAARAAVVADTDSKLGDPRPGQRPRTMAEVATPTFAADQIDTASLPPSAEPVATVSQQLPAVVSVPVAPMRRRLIAFRNQRLISAILLLLLGVFTGTGIRFATHRSDRPPRRSGSESATPRETKGLPRDGQLPDQHPLRLSPSAEAFQPE